MGDANQTGKIDVNDVQFVFDLYNEKYSKLSSEITVQKLLAADVNHDELQIYKTQLQHYYVKDINTSNL